jgi:hypothetical protein
VSAGCWLCGKDHDGECLPALPAHVFAVELPGGIVVDARSWQLVPLLLSLPAGEPVTVRRREVGP